MALLVTGSMGHVGLKTVQMAAARGHRVLAQYRGTFRPEIAEALGSAVSWHRADLDDETGLEALVDQAGIEGVIHTAAVPNENVARPNPYAAVKSNVGVVAQLLEAARRRSWRRFVFVSTGSVFQDATDTNIPILEDRAPSVANIYSTTKRCGEMLTSMYRSQFGISAASVRISWVYGPPLVPRMRENPRGPIPWFLKCALAGVPVDEPGGADFQASFTHVADVAEGLLAAYEAKELHHDVYHLGSGKNFTTADVVRAVGAAVPGARIAVGPGTAPWTDHTRMRGPLSGDRLLRDTGWQPRLSLEQGIADFAEWMRSNRKEWE